MPEAREIIVGKERLTCGERIGGGNEGDAYRIVGKPNLAVKIYKKNKRRSREGKIRAMVSERVGQKTSLVAFPLSIVTSLTGEFLGFSMRLMSGRYELHELYHPTSRKKHFPSADYRFVVRAALNVARAVGTIHNLERCVIGDLNHSSILVAQDATVVLIDADSIQFKMNGKTYPCVVGVPEFTPPELHGKRLANFERTIAHDNFGLAVTIFHLLFMGIHPFSGRGPAISIGEAILQNRFAYSIERRAETKTTPPRGAGALTLDQFPSVISRRFEDAFGLTPTARPGARDWMEALDSLESTLVQCNKVDTHWYPGSSNGNRSRKFGNILSSGWRRPGTLNGCVWCRISRITREKEDMFPVNPAVAPNISTNAHVARDSLSASEAEVANQGKKMRGKQVEVPASSRNKTRDSGHGPEMIKNKERVAEVSRRTPSTKQALVAFLGFVCVIFGVVYIITASWILGIIAVVGAIALIIRLGGRIH